MVLRTGVLLVDSCVLKGVELFKVSQNKKSIFREKYKMFDQSRM